MNPEEETVQNDIPVDNFDGFVDPTPSDPIDKTDIQIWQDQQLLDYFKEYHTQEAQGSTDLLTKIQELIDQGASGSSALGDTNDQILTLLQNNLPAYFDASATIVSYGTVWAPLIIVCSMMWWFFKQFLYTKF